VTFPSARDFQSLRSFGRCRGNSRSLKLQNLFALATGLHLHVCDFRPHKFGGWHVHLGSVNFTTI
jgi:hypothetical protein